MKCPNCNNNTSELESQKEDNDLEYGNKTMFLRLVMAFLLISSIIGAIILWNNKEIGIGFLLLFGGIILSAFIKGFTDIIDLLDDINNKLN